MVCASHSPLLLIDMPRSAPDSQDFLARVGEVRARVERFAPDLVVAFGPDHFNGFFFDLMPVFCVGAAAGSTEDWQLPRTELNVPSALALDCVQHLRGDGRTGRFPAPARLLPAGPRVDHRNGLITAEQS